MSLSREQQEFTWQIGQLIMFANGKGYKLTFGDAFRSAAEQMRLYNEGKSQIKSGGNHGRRLAVDFNLFKKVDGKWTLTWAWEDYKVLGDYWEALDEKNRWGGDWNKNDIKDGFIDSPHFERNI